MLQYVCNRCKKLTQSTLNNEKSIYQITVRGPNSKTAHGYDEGIDLCIKCFKDFKNEFMKSSSS